MKALKLPSPLLLSAAFWQRLGLVFFLTHQAASLCHAGGSVVAWGRNNALQTQVPGGLLNVVAVAAGDAHSLALNGDGTVVGWGFNLNGQATPPADLSNVVAIAAGNSYSMALKADGTVRVWGLQSDPPPGLSDVMAIAAGWTHCLALRSDGTVVAWGDNTFGQTNVPAGLTDVVAIAGGRNDSLALKRGGKVIAWGDDSFGKTEVPVGLVNVVAIAAGQDHCLALKGDGTVTAWGGNSSGQTAVPTGLNNIVAVSAGAAHSLALRLDGTLAAWGDNTYNQSVVNPTQPGYFGISAGEYHNLGVRSFGLPTLLSQPETQSVGTSSTVSFQVTVVGTPPLAFQWQKNGVGLAGATNPGLVLPNVQTNDTGIYSVAVSNAFGVVTSTGAVLTVSTAPPAIKVQPLDQSIFCGESGSFQVSATGSSPLSYQWLFQGAPIPSATDSVLPLPAVTSQQAGAYTVVVTNIFGAATSAVANLTVVLVPPSVTSPLTASGKQGQPFSYTITALHAPTSFSVLYLPAGLTLDPVTGVISGIPQENGTFGSILTAANDCTSDSKTLVTTFAPSIPTITSGLFAFGSQGVPFTYTIQATESPTSFSAQNLPAGLTVNPATGVISGTPAYPGDFFTTITASNAWAGASALVHFSFSAQAVNELSIANVTYSYSSPYLLNFQFSLRDSNDPTMGNAVVLDPTNLVATGFEDEEMVSTNETSVILHRGSAKVTKAYLVLDFTESVASLVNGDKNTNGISDAVDFMVSGAQSFVNQQPNTTQIGVYEFHREDVDPANVLKLTTDKTLINNTIAGIWTNNVKGFSAGSRCWDALAAAIKDLGGNNPDEQHFIVFVSDGRDESSLKTTNDVIKAATNANVAIYCVGFGADLDVTALQSITSATSGRYYSATNSPDLGTQFANIAKDFNGQYVLRWATLKRGPKIFMPSFSISYGSLIANSPTNPWYVDTNNPIVDTNTTPPTTNYNNITNFIIPYYTNNNYTGDVTVGSLRLSPNADVHPTGLTLRTTYLPRYIRQIRLHYRANWPVTTSLQSTNPGELFAGWSLVQTNDGTGGVWALLSSPNPADISTSLRFADFGSVMNFNFRDTLPATSNAFSLFVADNSLYTNTGKQSFAFDTTNLNSYLALYPVLTNGTPVPWLIAHGYSSGFQAAEVSDTDGDGMLAWQEYQANTDPRDPNSKFFIRSVAPGPDGRNEITFPTAVNRTYRVDSSLDLITWQTVQDGIVGTGSDQTVSDPALLISAPQVFYRVRVY